MLPIARSAQPDDVRRALADAPLRDRDLCKAERAVKPSNPGTSSVMIVEPGSMFATVNAHHRVREVGDHFHADAAEAGPSVLDGDE